MTKTEKLLLETNKELIRITAQNMNDLAAIYLTLSTLPHVPAEIQENYKKESDSRKETARKLLLNVPTLETILKQS